MSGRLECCGLPEYTLISVRVITPRMLYEGECICGGRPLLTAENGGGRESRGIAPSRSVNS